MNGDDFTPFERERLRRMMTSYERYVWLFGLIGSLTKWIAGVSAALIAAKMGLDWVASLGRAKPS